MLDPFLPEFSITNISATDKPVLTLPPNSQEWLNNFKEPSTEFKVTVQFVSSCYGNFYQRLVFDFGSNPKIVRNLGVMVAPEQSLVKQLTYKIAREEENELAWLSKYPLFTYEGKVDDGKCVSWWMSHPLLYTNCQSPLFSYSDLVKGMTWMWTSFNVSLATALNGNNMLLIRNQTFLSFCYASGNIAIWRLKNTLLPLAPVNKC